MHAKVRLYLVIYKKSQKHDVDTADERRDKAGHDGEPSSTQTPSERRTADRRCVGANGTEPLTIVENGARRRGGWR